MEGINDFALVLAFSVLVISLSIIVVSNNLFGSRIGLAKLDPNTVMAYCAVASLILGTAATVAGAVASIRVANLGVLIARDTDSRENRKFLEERGSKAIETYSAVLDNVNSLFAASINLELSLDLNGDPEKLMTQEAPADIKVKNTIFRDHLQSLAKSIRSVNQDEFSSFCFYESTKGFTGKLVHLSKAMIAAGQDEVSSTVRLDDLGDIASLIEVSVYKSQENTNLAPLIAARLSANASQSPMFGMPYDNANVRSLFFLGAMTFLRTVEDKKPIFAFYGSAILHDLVLSMPTGENILRCLRNRYSSLWQEGKIPIVEFHPTSIAGPNFISALDDADKYGDLYFLRAR